jgi:hypothetical protein
MLPDNPTDLLESVAEALQTMAFVMVEPAPAADIPPPAEGSLYAVGFHAQSGAGEVQIAAPRALGELLAVNMLAAEPGSAEALERADDILRELCNISAGLLLRRWGPPLADSAQMSLPACRALDAEGWHAFARSAGAAVFLAEGLPVAVAVRETV